MNAVPKRSLWRRFVRAFLIALLLWSAGVAFWFVTAFLLPGSGARVGGAITVSYAGAHVERVAVVALLTVGPPALLAAVWLLFRGLWSRVTRRQ